MNSSLSATPALAGIHHFTLRCKPSELEAVRAFYEDVLGMKSGPRPAFNFPGHWMYVEGCAIVHLAAVVAADDPGHRGSGSGFDHVSIHARGLDPTREHLKALAVSFDEVPVPGWPLQQIFLEDPVGSKIELTFDISK